MFESRAPARALAVLAAAIFIASSAVATGQVAAAPALNVVQVNLQTANNLPYQYTMTAYNTSGYQVASYQSGFPGAAFQLPAGTYLLSASAYYYNSTVCLACVAPAGTGVSTGVNSGAGASIATIVKPYGGPYSEYGYSVTQVTGPASISIALKNATALPLTPLTIHVGYANGTAAAGASVSAYVVGSYYVYSPKTVSYGQTDKSGSVTLQMPQAPVDISAYLSIPLKLPGKTSTITVNVGGQMVNVTVYLEPSYLSLNGEGLVLPPQTSASVVLHYQPNSYPIVYAGSQGSTSVGSLPPSGTTAQTTQQTGTTSSQTGSATRIAPFNPTGDQLTASNPVSSGSGGTGGMSGLMIEVAVIGGVLVVAVAVSALFLRKSRIGAPPA